MKRQMIGAQFTPADLRRVDAIRDQMRAALGFDISRADVLRILVRKAEVCPGVDVKIERRDSH
jgi:hypothetical protein